MKLKRFTCLLLTFVMSAACITTGFADDTADITEVYETVETEETEETVYIEDISEETEETAEEIGAKAVISEEEPTEEETEEPEIVLAEDSEEETETFEETETVTETEITAEIDIKTETNADLASTITYPVTGGNITINTSTGVVTKCDTSVTEATIPSSYSGVSIKSIGSNAFMDCTYITSVTIPSGLT
ncbi:MAG: leucine-rich repeat domain-containing protein [Clostridiales bacterium]|nr:leucine-rich repeat domain-containing protein [Clostridiales bacterium]